MYSIFAIHGSDTERLRKHVAGFNARMTICGHTSRNNFDVVLLQDITEGDLTAIKLTFPIKPTTDREVQAWVDDEK